MATDKLPKMHTIVLRKRGDRPEGFVEMKGGTNPHYAYYVSEKPE